jgi:hypothetical protein
VRYLQFLARLHEALDPPTYLEIGVRNGASLARSRARSIAVDPEFTIKKEIDCPVTLVRTTSDEYFARPDALAQFGGQPPALSFIDGMHLFEYALRDFMNVEARSEWWSAIVFDDMMPRTLDEAARERITQAWTGDVYKVLLTLRRLRPDLICLPIGTEPTGLVAVLGADPASGVLAGHYEALLAEHVLPDPQSVPEEILQRAGALDPELVLASPAWDRLRVAGRAGTPREKGMAEVRRILAESLDRPELLTTGR